MQINLTKQEVETIESLAKCESEGCIQWMQ